MNVLVKNLKSYLMEEKKKKEENKVVFIETDPQLPFPSDTISALQKNINKLSKDLTVNWKSAVELVNKAFENMDVPLPKAFLINRWKQYVQLLSYAIEQLQDSRGVQASWSSI